MLKGRGERECLYAALGNIIYSGHFGNQYRDSSKTENSAVI